jgi:hypothetical protein
MTVFRQSRIFRILWTPFLLGDSLASELQTPGNHPIGRIQHSEHGESLKSRIVTFVTRCPIDRQLSSLSAGRLQSTSTGPVSFGPTLIFSCHLRLGVQTGQMILVWSDQGDKTGWTCMRHVRVEKCVRRFSKKPKGKKSCGKSRCCL